MVVKSIRVRVERWWWLRRMVPAVWVGVGWWRVLPGRLPTWSLSSWSSLLLVLLTVLTVLVSSLLLMLLTTVVFCSPSSSAAATTAGGLAGAVPAVVAAVAVVAMVPPFPWRAGATTIFTALSLRSRRGCRCGGEPLLHLLQLELLRMEDLLQVVDVRHG